MDFIVISSIWILGLIIGYWLGKAEEEDKLSIVIEKSEELFNVAIKEHVRRMRSEKFTEDEEEKYVHAVAKKAGMRVAKKQKKA